MSNRNQVTTSLRIYRGSGNDGYVPGSWGYMILDGNGNVGSHDGGFSSREAALEHGRAAQRLVEREGWASMDTMEVGR